MSDQTTSDQSPVRRSEEDRRRFLTRVTLTIGGVCAGAVAAPTAGFIVAPIFARRKSAWRDIGAVDDFTIGATVLRSFEQTDPLPWAGATGKVGAWVRRESAETFIAFSISCRHLGCPVRWEPGAKLFLCPCHGGAYYPDGTVAAGPPPEPLKRMNIRIEDGRVLIEASGLPLTLTTTRQAEPRDLDPQDSDA